MNRIVQGWLDSQGKTYEQHYVKQYYSQHISEDVYTTVMDLQ